MADFRIIFLNNGQIPDLPEPELKSSATLRINLPCCQCKSSIYLGLLRPPIHFDRLTVINIFMNKNKTNVGIHHTRFSSLTLPHVPLSSTIAIFELGLPFDPRMMPRKCCDNIANGLGVILLTETSKQRHKQSYKQTLLTTMPPLTDSMGDFTFCLSPWLSLLVEPKSRLSRR